jgi:putative membrane protein
MQRMHGERCLAKGFMTGLAAGVVAAWAMNQFWTVQSKIEEQLHPSEQDKREEQSEQRASDNPTVKVAEAITRSILGRSLSQSEKKTAGSVVHYAFGALIGGLYGVLSEGLPAARAGFGTAYGAAVWLGADEGMVPALKLSKPPQEYPVSQHVSGLGAHLVYGATAEAVRRALRAAA